MNSKPRRFISSSSNEYCEAAAVASATVNGGLKPPTSTKQSPSDKHSSLVPPWPLWLLLLLLSCGPPEPADAAARSTNCSKPPSNPSASVFCGFEPQGPPDEQPLVCPSRFCFFCCASSRRRLGRLLVCRHRSSNSTSSRISGYLNVRMSADAHELFLQRETSGRDCCSGVRTPSTLAQQH